MPISLYSLVAGKISRMAMSKAKTLPEEIIVDILSRLPVKSIGQYRCVSKQWFNLLSDPQFIKFHHTHIDEDEKKLIFVSSSRALYTITFNHNPQNGIIDAISRKINFHDNWEGVAGSCNGLVLLQNQEHILFLINPITLEYHRIPRCHLYLPLQNGCRYSMYGLGYDFVSDDYKVVSVSRYLWLMSTNTTSVDVYSAKMGLWRRLENLPYNDVLIEHGGSCGVLVNGALHLFALKPSLVIIVAFDLSDEKFLEVPAPVTIDNNNLDWYYLRTLKGCLCLFSSIQRDEINVWMMREYRVEKSWTTFRVVVPDVVIGLTPLFFMRDDVVLDVDGAKLIVYNMKEERWRDMMVDGVTSAYDMAKTFTESLVSPKGYCIA